MTTAWTRKPGPLRVLDLFCGQGGAAAGYHGVLECEVIGVDIVDQPRYPFPMYVIGWLEGLYRWGTWADLIHASPPCHDHQDTIGLHEPDGTGWMLQATIDRLQAWRRPFVVENVSRAKMDTTVILCGSMFGLAVRRHRRFLCSFDVP